MDSVLDVNIEQNPYEIVRLSLNERRNLLLCHEMPQLELHNVKTTLKPGLSMERRAGTSLNTSVFLRSHFFLS